jgi:hypothetical protein
MNHAKQRVAAQTRRFLLALLAAPTCSFVAASRGCGTERETAAAFDHYIGASEGRIKSELHNGPSLFDELPEKRRRDAYAQLREGQVLVKQVNTRAEGHPIEVPQGLIHDWIGVLFIPNASLVQTLAVVQDYDNHQNIYKPEVRNSKLLQRNGDRWMKPRFHRT